MVIALFSLICAAPYAISVHMITFGIYRDNLGFCQEVKHAMLQFSALVLAVSLCVATGCKTTEQPHDSKGKAAPAPKAASPSVATTAAKASANECTGDTVLDPKKAGSPGNLIASSVNPNGDSELAVLMRTMRDDLRNARDHLLRDTAPPPLLAKHTLVRCAWPTDPNVRDTKFDQMAISYLLAVEDLERERTISDKKMAYGRAINACVTCHQNTCPGPIAAIKSLELPE